MTNHVSLQEAAAPDQTEKLAAAHAVLRKSAERLSDSANLDDFLREVLQNVAKCLRAPGATMWINDLEKGVSHLHWVYQNGQVIAAAESDHPNATVPSPINEEGWRVLLKNRVEFIKTEAMIQPEQREYFRQLRLRGFLSIPLRVQGVPVGSMSARIVEGQPDPTTDELEFAQALASQAALALHLSRLSEKASQASAAQATLSILSRSNQALRLTAEKLVTEPRLEAFLGQSLQALVETFGGTGGALWRTEPEGVRLLLEFRDGIIHQVENSPHPTKDSRQTYNSSPAAREVERKLLADQIVTIHVSEEYGFEATAKEYLESQGVKRLVLVPLNLGGQHLGRFSIRLQDARPLTTDETELAKALATQAALAMELTRLAAASQAAAVAAGRAEILTRANQAMHKSLATLTDSAEMDKMLQQVLRTVVERLGEEAGGVWLVANEDYYLHLTMDHGKVQKARSLNHPAGGRLVSQLLGGSAEHNANIQRMRQNVAYVDGPDEIATLGDYTGVRDYLKSNGIRSILTVPLFAGETWLGCITVRGRYHDNYPPEDIAFAQALANQASLALHISKLAAQAQEAAIANEREAATRARAEKLAAANRLLRESAERLGAIEEIDAFLGQVLLTIHDLVGGHSATVWVYDDRGLGHLRYVVEQGKAISAGLSSHPNATTPYIVPGFADQIMTGFGTRLAEPFQRAVRENPGFTKEHLAYFESIGVTSTISVPMILSGKHLGELVVRLGDDRPLLDDDRELIQSLANQAAVALHLTRLAEQAKEAAVAREREEAAKARAQKLATANRLLRESAERLGTIEEIDAFLGQVLLTINDLLDGHSATVWLRDEADTRLNHLRYVVEKGVAIPAELSSHPNANTPHKEVSFASEVMPGIGTAAAQSYQRTVAEDPGFTAEQRSYLASIGVRSMVSVPMVLSGRHLGTFTIRLTDERPLLNEDGELIQSLANQAAVALHLTRLAEQAKEAAIAREREEAAKARADELAKANAAIRSTLDVMTSIPAIDDLLGRVLLSITEHLTSPGATLWIYDDQGASLHLTCLHGDVYRKAPVVQGHTVRNRTARQEETDPARETTMAFQHLFLVDAWRRPDLDPETAEWMKATGAIGLLVVPLRVGGSTIGVICIHKPDNDPFPPAQVELAVALVQQAALAMHVSSLAQQARNAAIAKEREEAANKRAEALAGANAAIRSTLDRLAEQQSLDAFLSQAVSICALKLGAVGAGIWIRSEDLSHLLVSYEDGEVRFVDRMKNPGSRLGSEIRDSNNNLLLRGEIIVNQGEDLRSKAWYPAFREYLESRGIVAIANVPVFISQRWVGSIVLRYTHNPSFPEEVRELAFALANQVALALELTRLSEQAQAAAVSAERNRMAMELHDTLAQGFAAISMQVKSIERSGATLPESVHSNLETVKELAQINLVEARRSVRALRSVDLNEGGFDSALEKIVVRSRRLTDASVTLTVEKSPALTREIEDQLLRIAQEALNNAIKHAAASKIRLSVRTSDAGCIQLSVIDDGIGFDPDQPTAGFGLHSVQRRAANIGAELTIVSDPGNGTQVILTLPLRHKEAET